MRSGEGSVVPAIPVLGAMATNDCCIKVKQGHTERS